MTGSHAEKDVLPRQAAGMDKEEELCGGVEMNRGPNLRLSWFLPQLILHPFDDLRQDFACLALD